MRIKQKNGRNYVPVTLRSMLGSFERISKFQVCFAAGCISDNDTWVSALENCHEKNLTLWNINSTELKDPQAKYVQTIEDYYNISSHNVWLSQVLAYDLIYNPRKTVYLSSLYLFGKFIYFEER